MAGAPVPYSDLIAEARRQLGDLGVKRWTDEALLKYWGAAARHYSAVTRLHRLTETLNTADGTELYTLSTVYLIQDVMLKETASPLRYRPLQHYQGFYPDRTFYIGKGTEAEGWWSDRVNSSGVSPSKLTAYPRLGISPVPASARSILVEGAALCTWPTSVFDVIELDVTLAYRPMPLVKMLAYVQVEAFRRAIVCLDQYVKVLLEDIARANAGLAPLGAR